MLILKGPEKKKLVLGDYVAVHVTGIESNQSPVSHAGPCDVLVQHEDFFKRIQKDRRELSGMLHRKAA